MPIKIKLSAMFLAIALIPLLLVSALAFNNFKKTLEAGRLALLQDLALFKAEKIETYFAGLKTHMELLQNSHAIKTCIPVMLRLADSPADPEFITAKKTLDTVLGKTAITCGFSDIIFLDAGGKVIYSLSARRAPGEFSGPLADTGQTIIKEGQKGFYLSDIYFNKLAENQPALLIAAPALDSNDAPLGIIAMEKDMLPVFKLIQDVTGLGKTGETLIGRKIAGRILFLNPLRHDPQAAMKRSVTMDSPQGIPIQMAAEGQNGSGVSIDYRGTKVVAAWRYIPSLDWGLVAKIDIHEAFAEARNIGALLVMILFIVVVLSGIMAVSIAQSISGPIIELSRAVQAVGSGELHYEAAIDSKDEIGQLAKSFSKMTCDLNNLVVARDTERQRLYDVLETLPVYVILLTEDYRVPFANKFFRERFGASGGKRCYEYLFNRPEPCDNCESYKVLETGKPHHWEWTGPDGRNYDIHDFPFRDTDGARMVLEMGIDITAQKRAQESLRSASLYARSLIEASLDPLVTISSDGKITDVNEATIKVTGVPRENLVGTDFSVYFTEPEKAREGYQKVFAAGFVTDYPLTIRGKDGHLTDVLYNASVYRDARGNVLGVFAAARDVTVLKQAESELKRYRDQLETLVKERTAELQMILDTVPAMIFYKDKQNKFVRVNKAFENAMGLPKNALEGKSLFDIYPKDAAEAYWKDDLEIINSGKYNLGIIEPMKSAGGLKMVQTDKVPYFDESGKVAGIIGFAIDITERLMAERALIEAGERLEFAQQSAGAGMWDWDIATGNLQWTAALFRLFGLDPEKDKATFETWRSVIDPEYREAADKNIAKAITDHKPLLNEYPVIQPDGKKRWINAIGNTTYDKNGKPLRMSGICIDITERQRAEDALRQSELLLKRSQTLAHLGSWELDVSNGHLTWSDEVYTIFGFKPKEFAATYKAFLEAVHPDDRAAVDASYSRSLRENTNGYEIEHRIIKKSTGEVRIVYEKGEHIRDGSGKVMRTVGMVHDVTELRNLQAREQEALAIATAARTAMDSLQAMGEGVLLMDMKGHILSVNPALETLTGLSKNELQGKLFTDLLLTLVEEKDKPAIAETYKSLLNGIKPQLQPLNLLNKSGRSIPVIPAVSFIRDSVNNPTAVIVTVRDISEIRAMQKNLEKNYTRLRTLAARLATTEERERQRISAQIHDTVIQSLSLSNIKLGALRKELAATGSKNSLTEVTAIRAIIEEAIRESRSLMAELTPPLLYELGLVPAVNSLAHKLSIQHKVPILVKEDEHPKPIEKSIKGILFQATRELILNALKHAGECAITVTVARDNDRLRICVEDTGAGFHVPEEGRFLFRSDGGFGLFAIRERLERIGGSLAITSKAGAGTSATLFAPLELKPPA